MLKIEPEEYIMCIDIPLDEGIFFYLAEGDVTKYGELRRIPMVTLLRAVYMRKAKMLNELYLKLAQIKRDLNE